MPVKIVESLGWAYVAFTLFMSVIQLPHLSSAWPVAVGEFVLCVFPPVPLILGMVLALRMGRRAFFLGLHIVFLFSIVMFYPNLALLVAVTVAPEITIFVVLLLFAARVVLLYLPSSNLWFMERSGGKVEPKR